MRYLLRHLLEDAARLRPDGIAVVDGDRSISYAELDDESGRLAGILLEQDIERGDRVAFYLDKSIESVVAIHAILRAGAVYVPLDPAAPPSRLAYIIRNCGVRCLITGIEKQARWAEVLHQVPSVSSVVVLNAAAAGGQLPPGVRWLWRPDVDVSPPLSTAVPQIEQDIAYILYTSGSTGDPKGVTLSHRNALAFVDWAVEQFGVDEDDRLSSHAPFHFDLSVFDLFAAVAARAPAVLVPPRVSVFPIEVARFIREREITTWYSVPSILSMMTAKGQLSSGDFPRLRTILFAGEVFPTKYLRQLMSLLPHVRFANLYGPTETNVCTWYDVPRPPEDDADIPIGRPIANDMTFVVTADGRLAVPGEVGELYVRGATVMRGYWADPERTARGLVPDPFAEVFADPVYRTGDLVRQELDGNYRYLGRRDNQIKSRGYRIELGEIETALHAHPGVIECVVVAVPDELVTNRIEAFVVTRDGVGPADLTRFCAERIPRYMVPEHFVILDELPKTSTGKVDRRALTSS